MVTNSKRAIEKYYAINSSINSVIIVNKELIKLMRLIPLLAEGEVGEGRECLASHEVAQS